MRRAWLRRWRVPKPSPTDTFVYLLILVVALLLSRVLFDRLLGVPVVGLIRMSDTIFVREVAHDAVALLRDAEQDPSIRAVVLEIDSLGGETSSSEEVYLNVWRLRQHKPVVAYFNVWGVSGAYYVAAPANEILAKAGSNVGNVGAVTLLPDREEPDEAVMPSGPFKRTGRQWSERVRELEASKQVFLQAVFAHRGGRLRVDTTELGQGLVYRGLDAQRRGLVDAVGSSSDAIDRAARLAGIARYRVVDLNQRRGIEVLGVRPQPAGQKATLGSAGSPQAFRPQPGQSYYLYIASP
ncbi:MAG: S49 family peptidase [Chloroflexi bacterium]|nr:S49 family peptidase [Chloroflexota bacterium]